MPAASRLDIHLFAIAASITMAACGPAPQQGGFHGFPPADVTLMTVETKSIPVTFEYVGQALGSKEVEVRARVGGILEKRLFKEGAAVKSGQTLFVIDRSRTKRRPQASKPIWRAPKRNAHKHSAKRLG